MSSSALGFGASSVQRTASIDSILADAVLIVAHPDDEALWFSSIVGEVGTIVIVYGDVPGKPGWSAGRKELKRRYPYKNAVFLGLCEPVSIFGADWANPEPTGYGLRVAANRCTFAEFDAGRYESNYGAIVEQLTPYLTGASAVFTHNPWGEYGHEDHVQVSLAVSHLAQQFDGVPVWYSNYVSDRSARLMAQTMSRTGFEQAFRKTNPNVLTKLERLYRETGCWTWTIEPYEIPAFDGFFRLVSNEGNKRMRGAATLNYLTVDRAVQFRNKTSLGLRLRRWCVSKFADYWR